MSARSRRTAADSFVARLRRAVSCVTPTHLLQIPSASGAVWLATLAASPTPLRAPEGFEFVLDYTFSLTADQHDRPPIAIPIVYRYTLRTADASEILAFHWHPDGPSHVTSPHLHVSARHASVDLSKLHLPTGPVSPITFIRCLITEFGVEPLRPDWQDILTDA